MRRKLFKVLALTLVAANVTHPISAQATENEDTVAVVEEVGTETPAVETGVEVVVGDYTYTIDNSGATIKSYNGKDANITLPIKVAYDGINYRVKTVGTHAFKDNASIQTLVVPKEITKLDDGAFSNCVNLKEITINGNLEDANSWSADRKEWTASYYAVFYNAGAESDSLTVKFGPEVTRVPDYLFASGCDLDIEWYAHVTSVVLSDSVTEVGGGAFYNCQDLKKITWGNKISKINDCAFAGCLSLKSIELPNTITQLDYYAFANCTGATTLQLSTKLSFIDSYAFSGCSALTTVEIPRSVGGIADHAFADCKRLQRVYIPQTVTDMAGDAFPTNSYDLTIYGTAGSHIEEYAKEVGIAFKSYGFVEDVFSDIKATDWYVYAVQYAYDNGLMQGKGEKFQPNNSLKREEFVQILYSNSGKPAVSVKNKFSDVKNDWYTNAVLWANEVGVASGKKDGTFGVGKEISRQDLALMLYKYAVLNNYDLTTESGLVDQYSDAKKVESYAKTALDWAITQGIMSGKGTGTDPATLRLDPAGKATRAECATMMMKLLKKN